MRISRKSPEEIQIMREGGKISALALQKVLAALRPGVTTLDLDKLAEKTILENGATPSFKTVEEYKFTTCININEGIVHGLPGGYKIKRGDVVSIDLGALYKGLHTDLSYTVEVESTKEKAFLEAGKRALEAGTFACLAGNRLGDVGYAIQKVIEGSGYTVSEELVGHGIGKELHESPYVPGYGYRGSGIKIEVGMVFAIEVIYQKGKPELALDKDMWTIKTADNSLSALFEHTVAVTLGGPQTLTI